MAMTINTPMLLVFASERACRKAGDAMQAMRAKLKAESQRAVYEWRMDAEQARYSDLAREIAQCPAVTMHVSAEVYYIIDGDTDMQRLVQVHERLKNAFASIFPTCCYAALWQIDGYGAQGQKEQKEALCALGLNHIVLLSNPDDRGTILPWDYCELAVLTALALNQSESVDARWLCTGYNRMGKPEKELDRRLRHTAMEYLCKESARAVDELALYSERIEPAICSASDRSAAPEKRFEQFLKSCFFEGFPTAEDAAAIPRDTRDETKLHDYADAFIRENADIETAKQCVDDEIKRCREAVCAAIRSEIHIESMIKLFGKEGFFMKEVLAPLRNRPSASKTADERRGLERLVSYQNRILYAQASAALEDVKAQIIAYAIEGYEALCQEFEREAEACQKRRDHARKAVCLSPDELQLNRGQTGRYDDALAAPAAQNAVLKNELSDMLWPENQEECDEFWCKKAASAADAIRSSDACFDAPFWKLIANDGPQVDRRVADARNGVQPMIFRYVPDKSELGYPWCWYPNCLRGVLTQNMMRTSDIEGDNLEILQLYALREAQDERDIAELLDDIPAFRQIEDEPQRSQDELHYIEKAVQPVEASKTEESGTAEQKSDFAVRAVRENGCAMLYWKWQGDQSAVARIRCKTDYDRNWNAKECRYADYHSASGCNITSLIRPGRNHVEISVNVNGQTLQSFADIVGKKRNIYYRVESELLGSGLKNEDETQRLKVYRIRVWIKDAQASGLERLRLARGGFTYPLNDGRYDSRTDSYMFRNICAEGGETLKIVARPGDEDEMNISEK